MPGIEMGRAFSALAWSVRLPSPLGWAGMMGAFGAPRFAGQRCPRMLSRNLQTPVPLRGEREFTLQCRSSCGLLSVFALLNRDRHDEGRGKRHRGDEIQVRDLHIRARVFIRALPEANGLTIRGGQRGVARPSHRRVRSFLWLSGEGPPVSQILPPNQRQLPSLAIRVVT